MNFKFLKKAVFHHLEEDHLLSVFLSGYVTNKIFIDIGGNKPYNAISMPLLKKQWEGILVEPIPTNAQEFRDEGWPIVEEVALTSPHKSEAGFARFYLAGGNEGPHSSLNKQQIDPRSNPNKEIRVQLATLEELLTKNNIKDIGLLSVDTEGTELDVLKGLDFSSHKVELILIEDWQRSSKLHRYLVKNGYKIFIRSGFNSWYLPKNSKLKTPILGYLKLMKKIYISSHIKNLKHKFDLIRNS